MENSNRLNNNIVIKHSFLLSIMAAKNPFWVVIGALPLAIFLFMQINWLNIYGYIFICVGVLYWTFLEYAIHRWLYHINIKNKKLRFIIDSFHFYHHCVMNDRRVLNAGFMTLYIGTLLMLTPLYFVFSFLNLYEEFFSFSFALIIAYQFYEYVHFQIHFKVHKKGYLQFIQKFHLHHHQNNWNKNFGNTSSLWDHIFRSYDPGYKTLKWNEEIENHFIKKGN